MGGSSEDSGPSDSDFGRAHGGSYGKAPSFSDSGKQSRERRARERKKSFQNYQRQRDAAKKGIDITITPKEAQTVRSNASLAMDFDKKARESKVNIPGLTGVAMSTISSINYSNIAAGLRGGGFAVSDSKTGEVVGVVKDGVYSGNVGFSPIGRKDATFSNNQYSVSEAEMGGGENDGPTETVSNTTPRNMTRSTSPTVSAASRRALISGAGGSAARRNLL